MDGVRPQALRHSRRGPGPCLARAPHLLVGTGSQEVDYVLVLAQVLMIFSSDMRASFSGQRAPWLGGGPQRKWAGRGGPHTGDTEQSRGTRSTHGNQKPKEAESMAYR